MERKMRVPLFFNCVLDINHYINVDYLYAAQTSYKNGDLNV